MKIAHLFVSNFLGAAAVDIATPAPVHLFAGRNGAGKSSLRDAVALALTSDLGRVGLKKEAGALVRAGADLATCQVETAEGQSFGVSIAADGKLAEPKRAADPMLAYVLDAQRFARLDDEERRAFLFGLMKLRTDGAAVRERLLARGCDAAKVERIATMLRAGFEAASKGAKEHATQAKGAWKAVTAETYGSEKAKTWKAPVPAHDAAAAKKLATELQHADVALESWQKQVGALQAELQRREGLRSKLPALREHAARLERIQAKLATDEEQLGHWEADLKKTTAAAGAGPRVGLVHALAEALHGVTTSPHAMGYVEHPERLREVLSAYEQEHGPVGATAGDGKAAARLPSIRSSRDLMASAVANDKRDLTDAQLAKATADSIDVELAAAFDADGLATANKEIEAIKAKRADLVKRADALQSVKAAAEAAEKKTADAAAHAADVAAWDAIGDALAPDGIPGEILAEALGPINERLAQSAADTGWPAVGIAADMAITGGGREYRLLSESERWRADAVLAEAIAHLSGVKLLVLDRFDVLDPAGRADLIAWLDVLAANGEIDTALVFGTLKALPAGLPSTIATHWLENGVLAQLKEAA